MNVGAQGRSIGGGQAEASRYHIAQTGEPISGATAAHIMQLQTSIGELAGVAKHLSQLADRLGVTWPPPPPNNTPSADISPDATAPAGSTIVERLGWQTQRLAQNVAALKTTATAIDAAL
jgi:hypothetical protein